MKKFALVLALSLTLATPGFAQLSKLTQGVGDLLSGLTGGAVDVDTEIDITTEGGLGINAEIGVGVDAGGVSAEVGAGAGASVSGEGVEAGAGAEVSADAGGVSAGVDAGASASVSSGGVSAGVDASAGTSATGGVSVGVNAGAGNGGVSAGVDVNGTAPGGSGNSGSAVAGAGSGTGNPGGVLGKDDGQSSGAAAVASKISSDLLNLDPATTVNVIVQFVGTPTSEELQRISAQGVAGPQALPVVNGLSFSLTAGKVAEIARESSVIYITPNRGVSAFLDYATTAVGADVVQGYGFSGAGIGVAVIDSGIYAHPDLKDAGCTNSRIVYEESFVEDFQTGDPFGHGTHVAGIVGSNGACAPGESGQPIRGVAPQTNLISLRVLNAEGAGSDSAVIAAIQRAIELKDEYNIRVINLSLGRPVFESYKLDPLCQAVEAAWQAGIVVVSASGNYGRLDFGNQGYGTITSPGNSPSIITVGSMKTAGTVGRADDEIASYSSKGPTLFDHIVKPDIVAPGNRLVSLLSPNSHIDRERLAAGTAILTSSGAASAYFHKLSGTSMAAPMVSGAVALLLENEPGLTPDQVKAQLMRSAGKSFPTASTTFDETTGETFYSQYDIFTIGAGYLDVHAALMSSALPPSDGTANSVQARYNPENGTVRVVTLAGTVWNPAGSGAARRRTSFNEVSLWGMTGVWGTTVLIDGSSAIWGTTAPWSTPTFWASTETGDLSAIWGTGSTSGNSAIWGTDGPGGNSAIWGTDGPAGNSAIWGTDSPAGTSAIWGTGGVSGNSAIWGTGGVSGNSAIWGTGDGLQFQGEE
jgi:serine protease AprX